MSMKTIYVLFAPFILLTLPGCVNQGAFLNASFDTNARVVRAWTEACVANNGTEAGKYLSMWETQQPDVCDRLGNHPNSPSFQVITIENRVLPMSMISAGNLFVIVKDSSTGLKTALLVALANTEQGPVVTNAVFADPSDYIYNLSDFLWK